MRVGKSIVLHEMAYRLVSVVIPQKPKGELKKLGVRSTIGHVGYAAKTDWSMVCLHPFVSVVLDNVGVIGEVRFSWLSRLREWLIRRFHSGVGFLFFSVEASS